MKYNPLKDGSLGIAFIFGGGPILPYLIFKIGFNSATLLSLVFLISWTLWIIYKKGQSGSLLKGFLIALVISAITFIPIAKLDEDKMNREIQKRMEQSNKEFDKYLEEMKKDKAKENKANGETKLNNAINVLEDKKQKALEELQQVEESEATETGFVSLPQ